MAKEAIVTPGAIGPYSPAIRIGSALYLSGQIPLDQTSGKVETEIAAAVTLVFDNIKNILSAAGFTMNDVVKTTVYLKDMGSFQAMNDVYARTFSAPYPARTTVEVSRLPKDVPVEIEVIAQR
ncbi:MAG: reactive intermediate/imine deaminase [Spirochaetes bacterium]|nr:reactive intermediate/imine deaminase [Spirochaetota bacterium]